MHRRVVHECPWWSFMHGAGGGYAVYCGTGEYYAAACCCCLGCRMYASIGFYTNSSKTGVSDERGLLCPLLRSTWEHEVPGMCIVPSWIRHERCYFQRPAMKTDVAYSVCDVRWYQVREPHNCGVHNVTACRPPSGTHPVPSWFGLFAHVRYYMIWVRSWWRIVWLILRKLAPVSTWRSEGWYFFFTTRLVSSRLGHSYRRTFVSKFSTFFLAQLFYFPSFPKKNLQTCKI